LSIPEHGLILRGSDNIKNEQQNKQQNEQRWLQAA